MKVSRPEISNHPLGVADRRRILMVSENGLYPDHLGGMEIRARELVSHLQDTYDTALLTKRDLTLADGRTIRVQAPRLEYPSRVWRSGRVWRLVGNFPQIQMGRRRLKKGLSALRPDLVYLHRFCSLHPVMVHDLLHAGRPVLAWFGDQHGALLPSVDSGHWVRRFALGINPLTARTRERVTLVFNCRFLHQFYAPLVQGYPNQFVIGDGVDTRRFHPAAAPPKRVRFAFLGRVEAAKGFLDFCRAMSVLPRALVGGIDMIGDGPRLGDGLQLLGAAGRYGLIGTAGSVPHDDVPDRLRTASVLVHPSQDEGMPAAVLEAMASGLAVVATAVGGTPEVVRDGETGLLTAPGDFPGLVAACRRLAEDADLRQRLGANARAFVASHCDVSRSLAAIDDLIAKTIDRGGFVGGPPERHWASAG